MDFINTRNNNTLKMVFPSVTEHQTSLVNLNRWWDKVALVGKINSLNVPQSLLSNMLETKDEFAELQELLIENLLSEQMQQVGNKYRAIAQTLIDIPNRNLFERTADVGFLATDAKVVDFLTEGGTGTIDAAQMQQHFLEYAAKYSVYDDVILFDANGRIKARMNNDVAEQLGTDPIVNEVLKAGSDYTEVCRFSTICPHKRLSSLFLATVKAPQTNKVLGVLCLSFKLEDEMAALFADLNDNSGAVMALLDSQGYVLESSDSNVAGQDIRITISGQQEMVTINNKPYFCTVAATRGYQGYMGLGWQGCVLMPFYQAVEQSVEQNNTSEIAVERWLGFSATLSGIQRRARIVTDDLDLVVLNGRIAAARSDADEFIPILEEIRQIGRQMQRIFSDSVSQLMNTALNTHYNALSAQAALAIDIMDRNLYERANDCRWWALTDCFIQSLSAAELTEEMRKDMSGVLAYINGLYTVYTGIYLYDRNGYVVAVSTPDLERFIGTQVPESSCWREALGLTSTQQYSVSGFNPSDYYAHRATYIYNAAIRTQSTTVGGIGLVFDSEPEFQQMLNDVLNNTSTQSMAIYVDRHGRIISGSTNSLWQAGAQLKLPSEILELQKGQQGAGIYAIEQQEYVIGYAVSKGYREYKTEDGYANDVIALMIERNVSHQS